MYARDYFDRLQSNGFETILYEYTADRSSFALPADLLYIGCKLPNPGLFDPPNENWRPRQSLSQLAGAGSGVRSTNLTEKARYRKGSVYLDDLSFRPR